MSVYASVTRRFVPFILLCLLTAGSARAQQNPSLSKRASEVRAKVGRLSPQARISVIPVQGEEEFGTFVSGSCESFSFYDVDRKMDVSLRYEDVKKVKDGYGGYNHLRGRHVDRTRGHVVVAIFAGALVALVVVAALTL